MDKLLCALILIAYVSFELLKRYNLSSLELITSTGDSLNTNIIKSIKEVLKNTEILPMYGLTECKRVSIMPYNRYDKTLLGSCGLPLISTKVTIESDEGKLCKAYEVGQIVVSGENVMEGYLNIDDGSKFQVRGNERILKTGDFGYVDNEGFLYFVRRDSCFIKKRGVKISCSEIEELFNNDNNIIQSCAVGIPDDIEGEKIIVFVIIRSPENHPDFTSLLKSLPWYMRPYKVIIKNTFPTTKNGKVDRNKLIMEAIEQSGK